MLFWHYLFYSSFDFFKYNFFFNFPPTYIKSVFKIIICVEFFPNSVEISTISIHYLTISKIAIAEHRGHIWLSWNGKKPGAQRASCSTFSRIECSVNSFELFRIFCYSPSCFSTSSILCRVRTKLLMREYVSNSEVLGNKLLRMFQCSFSAILQTQYLQSPWHSKQCFASFQTQINYKLFNQR